MAALTVQGRVLVPDAARDSILDDLQVIRAETQSRLHALNARRDGIEGELGMLVEVLQSASCGAVGLKGALIDSEGFPRADVDLYDVRRKRHRVAVLQTDHKDIMQVLETELKALHRVLKQISKFGGETALQQQPAAAPPSVPSARQQPSNGGGGDEKTIEESDALSAAAVVSVSQVLPEPFARVESVAAGSPAEAAGLRVGDQVVSFGDETQKLANLGPIVRDNENRSVPVNVVRSGARVELALIPRAWSGRGLLGCYLVPSESSITVERLYRPPQGNPEP
jgi:26S proteasome non-ATPase regulatory subunit 9